MNHRLLATFSALLAVLLAPLIAAAESSAEMGYEDGYIVGEASHNDRRPPGDRARLERLARINGQSHAEAGVGRSAADYQRAYIQGYDDGFAGKARGGGTQAPLPSLPIVISDALTPIGKNIGDIAPAESEAKTAQELSALISQNGAKTVFVIIARLRLNENVTEYLKFVYDRPRQHLLMLRRTEMRTMPDSFEWTLWLAAAPETFKERLPWGNTALRKMRSQSKQGKDTVPLKYTQSAAITQWP